jgi:hypothetical protein
MAGQEVEMKLTGYLLGATLAIAPAAWASSPSDVLEDQIRQDNADIVFSHEAALRAGTPAAAMYARQAEALHRAARARLIRARSPMDRDRGDGISPHAIQELQLLSVLVGREFDVEYLRYMARDQIQQARHLAENANAAGDRISHVAREEIPPIVRSARRARVLEYREVGEPHA